MDQQNESDFFGSVLKIALGIFFGLMLVWMVHTWRERYQLHQASVAFEQSMAAANVQAKMQQRQRDERALDKRIADQQRLQARAAAEFTARAEARRKDEAWARFFQRSDDCLRTSSVECGNQYIRARREFERLYAAGDLH